MRKKYSYTLLTSFFTIILFSQNLEEKINSQKNEIDSLKSKLNLLLKDTDGDGVSDYFDQEIETPIGARVDGSGKGFDTDMDGIYDIYDKCVLLPGIPSLSGCPELNPEDLVCIYNPCGDNYLVDFKFKEIDLSIEDIQYLKCMSDLFIDYRKDEKFYIEVHSNDFNSNRKNINISRRRAKLVYKSIISQEPTLKNAFIIKPEGNSELLYPECLNRIKCDSLGENWKNEANNRVVFKIAKNE